MKMIKGIVIAALALGGVLSAQSFQERVQVNLPAPVVVNGVTIPAGSATIQVLHFNGPMLLSVHAATGENATVLAARSAAQTDATGETKVILDHKGGAYRLNRVILPDNSELQVIEAQ